MVKLGVAPSASGASVRYIVFFGHRRYRDLATGLARAEQDLPEGIYRQLAVVVEAESRRAARDKAAEEVGWPHQEAELVPLLVLSQADVAAQLHAAAMDDDEPTKQIGAGAYASDIGRPRKRPQ